ncbi:hypothetical protein [Microbacterium testaceum]|uniref:hypothetical protein n=1 Tax=Microbacterium testaceum TaxID=2033 RepID=UPI002435D958|nr:hypothetical protein [Microbacterium testaceum]
MSTPNTPQPTKLLSSVPATAYRTQIVRYPHEDSGRLSYSFQYAADALASTYTGKNEDDSLLLPYLTLYRQAFELRLKYLIAFLASTRQTYVEGVTPELTNAQSTEHIRKKFGHNLGKLLTAVETHYAALKMPSPFPSAVKAVILAFHDDDEAGVAFRYAGQLPEVQEHADFPTLSNLLTATYVELSLIEDYVDGTYSAGPTLHDLSSGY